MQSNGTRAPSKRRCKTCRSTVPVGVLLNGECATCAHLIPLPLRGESGRFLTFTPPKPEPTLTDPDPDLCCGVPALIDTDEEGRTTGTCTECGSLLWRQINPDDTTNDTRDGKATGTEGE